MGIGFFCLAPGSIQRTPSAGRRALRLRAIDGAIAAVAKVQETVGREPFDKPVAPEIESPGKTTRGSEPDAGQSADQKRIERFRER